MTPSRRSESERLPTVLSAASPAVKDDMVSALQQPSSIEESPVAYDHLQSKLSPDVASVNGSGSRMLASGTDVIDDESNYPKEDISHWKPDFIARQDQSLEEAPDVNVNLYDKSYSKLSLNAAPVYGLGSRVILVSGTDDVDNASNYPRDDVISRWDPYIIARQDQSSVEAPDPTVYFELMETPVDSGKNPSMMAPSPGGDTEPYVASVRGRGDGIRKENEIDNSKSLPETEMVGVMTLEDVTDLCEGESGDQCGAKVERIRGIGTPPVETDASYGINANNNTSPPDGEKQQILLKTTVIGIQEPSASTPKSEFRLATPFPGDNMICSGGVCRLSVPSSPWTTKTKHDEELSAVKQIGGSGGSVKMPPVE